MRNQNPSLFLQGNLRRVKKFVLLITECDKQEVWLAAWVQQKHHMEAASKQKWAACVCNPSLLSTFLCSAISIPPVWEQLHYSTAAKSLLWHCTCQRAHSWPGPPGSSTIDQRGIGKVQGDALSTQTAGYNRPHNFHQAMLKYSFGEGWKVGIFKIKLHALITDLAEAI